MAKDLRFIYHTKNQNGVVLIFIAVLLIVFIGFAALAVDVGHIVVVRNELKNAADAGALAGARGLYNNDGASVNPGANQTAYDAATANKSEKTPVEVNWTGGNAGDVERGHWSYGIGSLPKGFYANPSLLPVNLSGVTTQELDENLNFINAVKVTTRRESSPAASFFARVFGYQNFVVTAEAVAYIGFVGSLNPHEADQPIAICQQSLLDINGEYNCITGRMLNSGSSVDTHNTGAWSTFEQPVYPDTKCPGASSASVLKDIINSGQGNTNTIYLGAPMSTTGGVDYSVFKALGNAWKDKTKMWQMTLPVIDCPGNNVTSCADPVGAVDVKLVWINGNSPKWEDVPTQMTDPTGEYSTWTSTLPSDKSSVYPNPITKEDTTPRWESFIDYFKLKDADGKPASYMQKAIYFLPSCTYHDLAGPTGGHNFGILAKIPVLVK